MALQGAIPIDFGTVFPDGAYAAGVFEAVRDFDRSQGDRFVQQLDKGTGLPVWTVDVIDADPKARDRTVKVKVAAEYQPTLPPALGRITVHGGGVHRPDRDPVRQPGRTAGLLLQGDRSPRPLAGDDRPVHH